MKIELYHQHKKCERAGKCHRFPVFWVSYKLDGLTGLEGITIFQNPWILQTAGGNPLDIRACQEVWNIVFWDCLLSCWASRNTLVIGFFRSHDSLIFLQMEALWSEFSQDMSEGKSFPVWCGLMFLGMLSPLVFLPNHISPAVCVTATDNVETWVSPSKIHTIPSFKKGWLLGGPGRKAQCSHGVGTVPESRTTELYLIPSLDVGQGRRAPVCGLCHAMLGALR